MSKTATNAMVLKKRGQVSNYVLSGVGLYTKYVYNRRRSSKVE